LLQTLNWTLKGANIASDEDFRDVSKDQKLTEQDYHHKYIVRCDIGKDRKRKAIVKNRGVCTRAEEKGLKAAYLLKV